MADNYLESKFDELHKAKRQTVIRQVGQSLDTLLLKNRSYRGYDHQQKVSIETLKTIVGVNNKIPSARNQQVLRFKLVNAENGAASILENIKMGGALPELHLPFEGTEPEAFIIVCSNIPENKMVDIDAGISVQSMLLKAVELGLRGLIIGAFNKEKIIQALQLPYEPLLILAIGKGNENIRLTEITEGEDHRYYRKDGTHYVPKVRMEDLIIP
ncbi:MAG: nitroreductase family protein [Bacteroidales bacterium]|nr:nitroreductase family protein [Bacteroidales bacterium]